jgi:hypothetical protein
LRLAAILYFTASITAAAEINLKSAGPMAFGPDGILFIGDSIGGAVLAVDTRDRTPLDRAPDISMAGLDEKIAALLGTEPRQILINDVKVNPVSKNIYFSVSRGRGPDAIPVILRLDASGPSSGKLKDFSLDGLTISSAVLPNPPVSNLRAEERNPRLETITQLGWIDGKVIVAGLSNEEFASNLRTIPYPFRQVDKGASIEIFHGSHGGWETKAPVRTFVPYTIGREPYLIAAYTCTPLVTIPVSALKPGAKVTGKTIAELGMGNRPLDMIVYRKDGHDYILMANSYRGAMKLPAENLEHYEPILEQVVTAGLPHQRVSDLRDVKHLTTLDDAHALILAGRSSLDLRSFPLP